LRLAMRALAVSRRSMEAINRAKIVLEGTRPMDAVLDMGRLLVSAEKLRFIIWREFMYTRCQIQRICLHGSN
jgi:hypothetical protein